MRFCRRVRAAIHAASPDDESANEFLGLYRQLRPSSFTFEIGPLSLSSDEVTIEVQRVEQMGGIFYFHNTDTSGAVTVNGTPDAVRFLFGMVGTGYTTDSLPQVLSLAGQNTGSLFDLPPVNSAGFTIDSLEQIPVPEPSSLSLLAIAATAGAIVLARRGKPAAA